MALLCRVLARECQPELNPRIRASLWCASRLREKPLLLAIVINHPQGEANAAFQPAHSVPQAGPVKSVAAFHGTMSRSENKSLPALGDDNFSFRLCPGLLFHNYEFTAFVVNAGLAQKTGQLQREGNGTVHVLVETVEIAAFIVQQQRSGPRLCILRADIEKAGMTLGKNLGQSESLIPFISY